MDENQNALAQEQAEIAPAQSEETQAPENAQPAQDAQAAPAPAAQAEPAPESAPDELTQAREQLNKALGIALNAEARAAAAGLGVRAERVGYAVKLADLGGIDLSQDGASEKVAAAIEKVLNDMPELKSGAGTGSLGNHPRPSATPPDPFVRGLKM